MRSCKVCGKAWEGYVHIDSKRRYTHPVCRRQYDHDYYVKNFDRLKELERRRRFPGYKRNMDRKNDKAVIERRFWQRVEKGPSCWLWNGMPSEEYGKIFVRNKMERVHRFSYELVNGKIPDGLTIDHLCLNKRCVNPAHLEVVTWEENGRRGRAIRGMARKADGVLLTAAAIRSAFDEAGSEKP